MPAASVGITNRFYYLYEFWALLRKSNSAHSIFWAIAAVYYAAYLALRGLWPHTNSSNFLLMAVGLSCAVVPIVLIGLTIVRLYYVARHVRPKHPIAALVKDMGAFLANRQRLVHGLPMIGIMLTFMFVFDWIKLNITVFNPFSWDAALMHADQVLHFGYHPWQWLQPLLGYAPVTFLISVNYNMWFVIMWTMWVYFAFSARTNETRTRFFLTFFALWMIGGGLMAIYFSSAGPCFYSRLGLMPDPYAELLAYLRQTNAILPIWSIPLQDVLWQSFVNNSLLTGISGMPSMHNATALLFALAGFKINRAVGWLLLGHAVLILLGSIHLAWHYAIDGYVAWALTLVFWFAIAPVSRWWKSRMVQQDFAQSLEWSN